MLPYPNLLLYLEFYPKNARRGSLVAYFSIIPDDFAKEEAFRRLTLEHYAPIVRRSRGKMCFLKEIFLV